MNLKQLWKRVNRKCDKQQSIELLEMLYWKGIKIDHHPLLVQTPNIFSAWRPEKEIKYVFWTRELIKEANALDIFKDSNVIDLIVFFPEGYLFANDRNIAWQKRLFWNSEIDTYIDFLRAGFKIISNLSSNKDTFGHFDEKLSTFDESIVDNLDGDVDKFKKMNPPAEKINYLSALYKNYYSEQKKRERMYRLSEKKKLIRLKTNYVNSRNYEVTVKDRTGALNDKSFRIDLIKNLNSLNFCSDIYYYLDKENTLFYNEIIDINVIIWSVDADRPITDDGTALKKKFVIDYDLFFINYKEYNNNEVIIRKYNDSIIFKRKREQELVQKVVNNDATKKQQQSLKSKLTSEIQNRLRYEFKQLNMVHDKYNIEGL